MTAFLAEDSDDIPISDEYLGLGDEDFDVFPGSAQRRPEQHEAD